VIKEGGAVVRGNDLPARHFLHPFKKFDQYGSQIVAYEWWMVVAKLIRALPSQSAFSEVARTIPPGGMNFG